MRSIVFEDNSNSLTYWLCTLIIDTVDFIARCLFCPFSSSPCSILLLFLHYITQAPCSFFLVSRQVSNHSPFAQLSLTSLSSQRHYPMRFSGKNYLTRSNVSWELNMLKNSKFERSVDRFRDRLCYIFLSWNAICHFLLFQTPKGLKVVSWSVDKA